MKKFLFSCLLILAFSNTYAKSVFIDRIPPIDFDDPVLSIVNAFETADKVVHFSSQRVVYFENGEFYVCPHHATIVGERENRKCTTDGIDSAWIPLLYLNVDGYKIVDIRLISVTENDVDLLIYFRRTKQWPH